jgi:MFS family permease
LLRTPLSPRPNFLIESFVHSAEHHTPKRGHLGFAVLAHALLRVSASADATLVGLYLADLARSHRWIQVGLTGLLGATTYGAELIASLPMGLAADALSVRALMAFGALTGAIGTALFATAVSRPLFFVSRVLQGAGAAGVTPPLLAVLARGTQQAPALRARMMGYFELSLFSGLALGGLVGSELWSHVRRGAFGVLALVSVACAGVLFIAGPRASVQGTHSALRGLRVVLADRVVRSLAPVWVSVNAIVGLWLGPTLVFLLTEPPRSRQYLDGRFVAAPNLVGWLLLGYAAVFGTGVLLWTLILPKVRLYTALRTSLLAMLAVCVALYVLNHSEGWNAASRAALITGAALLIMIESGFTPAALTWLAASLDPLGGKGAAMGIYSVLLGVGAVVGSLLAGVLGAAWQVDGLLLGTALMALVALMLVRRLAGPGVGQVDLTPGGGSLPVQCGRKIP